MYNLDDKEMITQEIITFLKNCNDNKNITTMYNIEEWSTTISNVVDFIYMHDVDIINDKSCYNIHLFLNELSIYTYHIKFLNILDNKLFCYYRSNIFNEFMIKPIKELSELLLYSDYDSTNITISRIIIDSINFNDKYFKYIKKI